MSEPSGEPGRSPTRMSVDINTPRFNHATVGDVGPSVPNFKTVTPAEKSKKKTAAKKKKRMKAQRQKASREAAHEETLNHTQSHAVDIAMTKVPVPSMEEMWKQIVELQKRVDELRKDTDELWTRMTDELEKDSDEMMERATAELKNLFNPEWEEESQAAPREEDSQLLLLANDSFDELVVNLGGYKACNEAR
ncbi:hypothetical protein CPC08DRAFT_815643 [Agrocybe pediades]|nr:hypothetical protein CPC08DRAFT_815643 [Agrocybe pediades]